MTSKLKIQVNNTSGTVKVTLPDGTYTALSKQFTCGFVQEAVNIGTDEQPFYLPAPKIIKDE